MNIERDSKQEKKAETVEAASKKPSHFFQKRKKELVAPMEYNSKKDITVSICKHNLGENSDSKSVNCAFWDRGWLSQANCENCTHRNQDIPEKTVKENIEVIEATAMAGFACPNSKPVGYLQLGRICDPLGVKGKEHGTCFHWNKPDLVKVCPELQAQKQRNLLSERIESDFYASLPGGVVVR